MPVATLAEFVLLAAVWGGSFLFMRLGGGEFGPVPLAAVRASGAALVLLPLLAGAAPREALRRHWRGILLLGALNTALPFLCYAAATLALTAGLASILNATTPIWTALIAWAWTGARLDRWRMVGVAIAFTGVAGLIGDAAGVVAAPRIAPAVAVALCLGATALYGTSAVYARRHLAAAPPGVLAAGSQLAAALFLLLPAILTWPARSPGAGAWAAGIALAVVCTGAAYAMYFRLIARLGATATNVTFLIPVFGVLWGVVFLHEPFGGRLAAGCAVILLGTSLATGLWRPGRSRRPPVV